jgi:hypothetical protein
MNKNRNTLIFLVPLFTAILSLILFMLAVVRGWMGAPQGVGSDFCEVSDGLIKQPANTWSGLGFVTAGLVTAWLTWKPGLKNLVPHSLPKRFQKLFLQRGPRAL